MTPSPPPRFSRKKTTKKRSNSAALRPSARAFTCRFLPTLSPALQIGFLFVLSDLAAERGLLSERVTFDSIGVSHAQGCFASCPLVFQSAATIRPGRHYLEVPRYEVGIQFDFHYLDGVGEWGGGFGPRFHYNFNEHFALDSELTYRQHNVSTFNSLIPTSTVIG
jgi:hypothetical protein